jgi:GLPGLI family protein
LQDAPLEHTKIKEFLQNIISSSFKNSNMKPVSRIVKLQILLHLFIMTFTLQMQAQASGEVVYKCTFKENASFYRDTLRFSGSDIKEIKKVEPNEWKSKEGYLVSIKPSNDIWFFNFKTKQSVFKKYNFEKKVFEYISDIPKSFEWTILDEFKTIGKYKAQKASYKYKTQSGELTKYAWFTSTVPIQAGPDQEWGLPGLILELRLNGFCTCTMESIVMKPVGDIKFNENVTLKTDSKRPTQDKKKLNELLNKN